VDDEVDLMQRLDFTSRPEFSNLVELLRARAADQAESTAFTYLMDGEREEVSWTYDQVDCRARSVAARLQDIGAAGQPVLVVYPPGLDFLAGFFGCLYAGAIAVPVAPPRPNRPLSQLARIAADTRALAALTTDALLMQLRPGMSTFPPLDALPWIESDLVATAEAGAWRAPSVHGETLAFLQYTSGSTGSPKGVMVSHHNLLYSEQLIKDAFGLNATCRGLGWLPLYHDMGLIGIVLQSAYLGSPCVLMSPVSFLQRPLRWLQAITRHRATTSGGPSFAYEMCVRGIRPEQREGLDLSSWDLAFNGAEPVRADVIDRFCDAYGPYGFRREAFYPCYGLAEATLIATGGARRDRPKLLSVPAESLQLGKIVGDNGQPAASRVLVGCGRALGNERVVIVDPQTRRRCADRQIGEVWLSGGNVTQGYWNRAQETQETFRARLTGPDEGPFLRTGDLGFLCQNELYITGRIKEVIIVRGRNHYPQDIELTVERSHPACDARRGAVFSVDREGVDRTVVAQEVKREFLRSLDSTEVIARVRTAISDEHDLQVDDVLLLRPLSIPKTSSGKTQRWACRSAFLEGQLETVAEWHRPDVDSVSEQPAAPSPFLPDTAPALDRPGQEAITDWLVNRLAVRLQLPPREIDVQQPLARYGLDSVAAVNLAEELAKWLGRPLEPVLAYQYPTVELLARHLSQEMPAAVHDDSAPPSREYRQEPIAVIGLGCRFPSAQDPASFWDLLRDGVDAIGELPADRWGADRFRQAVTAEASPALLRGGFLPHIEDFDPHFFNISPREAALMDPQQRLLLEVAWEALEHANLDPTSLAGSRTGVFVGISSVDYSRLLLTHGAGVSAYSGTGQALSIAANRLSYVFDFRGPSLAIDTGCSSSLVALHQACQSLRHFECDLALTGGVNLILQPELTVAFSQAGMLAADGRCKTFSADADGYVRSEGCGVVILKRLADAVRDHDRVWALVLGSAVNQDGRSNGLTAPNGPSQRAVIRAAQDDAGVTAAEIDYVESHGSGTPLGDLIEFTALNEAFPNEQSAAPTCWVGSVKTNIGHLEAAAGIAGFIKTVLALAHELIPPHLHCSQPNPRLAQPGSRPAVACGSRPWVRGDRKRLAGVSSFGFGGTNVHAILAEAPPPAAAGTCSDRTAHILTLSARGPKTLAKLAARYRKWLAGHPRLPLADVCHTANTGRARLRHRLAVVTNSTTQLCQDLEAFEKQDRPASLHIGTADPADCQRLVFVFPGQIPLHAHALQWLWEAHPAFLTMLEEYDRVFKAALHGSLLEFLGTPDRESPPPDLARPASFAVLCAVARLWMSWGVRPDIVFGTGVGEFAAAHVAGAFSFAAGLRLATASASLFDRAARSTCPTGTRTAFEDACQETSYSMPLMTIASGSGKPIGPDDIARAEYWRQRCAPATDDASAVSALCAEGCRIFIELGGRTGHPIVDHQDAAANQPLWLASLDKRVTRPMIHESLAELHVRGMAIDWREFDRGRSLRKVSLPLYPFQQQRCWFDREEPDDDCFTSDESAADKTRPLDAWFHQANRLPPSQPRAATDGMLPAGVSALGSLLGSPTLGKPRQALRSNEVLIEIAASGEVDGHSLNCALPASSPPSVIGCAGRVLATGTGVTRICEGDHVLAVVPSHVVHQVAVSCDRVVTVPAHMANRQMALQVVPWLTAFHALTHVTRVHAGDRMLVAGAESPLRQAVVELAQRCGAHVESAPGGTQGEHSGAALLVRCPNGEPLAPLLAQLPPDSHVLDLDGQGQPDQGLIRRCRPDVAYEHIDIAALAQDEPALMERLLAQVVAGLHAHSPTPLASQDAGLCHQCLPGDSASRLSLLMDFLQCDVARLLGLKPEDVAPHEPLIHLGVDSLMALDLRNRVMGHLGVDVPLTAIMQDTSVASLAAVISEQMAADPESSRSRGAAAPTAVQTDSEGQAADRSPHDASNGAAQRPQDGAGGDVTWIEGEL
jgi:acyl transferase domain-containing protein/acyl-CoA synthetase (AMP-forming)/AMP-acid ligase II/acyl carrier protein